MAAPSERADAQEANLRAGAAAGAGAGASFGAGTAAGAGSMSTSGDSSLRERAADLLRNKRFEDSRTLTDPKLKAENGSLSRYSMKSNLSYYGPTLGNFSAPDQPNPDGAIGNYSQVIKGSIMARYRVDADEAINAGAGISFNHPFHGMDRTDLNNPFVSYDFSRRWGALQMRTSPGLTWATIPNYTVVGEFGGVTLDNSIVYAVARSRLAVGFDANLAYWLYDRTYRAGSLKAGGDGLATQYTATLTPLAKYNVTDSLQFYASIGFQLFNPRLTSDQSVMWSRSATARLGTGYAITRDVYLSPYLQGFVANLATEVTTINVSAIVSML